VSNQALMSDQTFEIRCPVCKSIVPADASGCPTCAATPSRKFAAAPPQPTPLANGSASAAAPAAGAPEGLGTLALKDYHRLVRANHRAIEGGRSAPGGFGRQVMAFLPGVLLLLALLAGAAKLLGWV
jgi:hypothetical protein